MQATFSAPADGPIRQDEAASSETRPWAPGRVMGLMAASVAGLIALALIAAGGTAIVLDRTQRDAGGYLMTSDEPYSTSTYAVESASYRGGTANDWFVPSDTLGTVRVRIQSIGPVFIGIGRESDVTAYLRGVARVRGSSFTTDNADFQALPGGAPSSPPGAQRFWSASSTGSGTHTLTWKPRSGSWRIVLMNANGSRGVSARISIGARFPDLWAVGLYALAPGLVLLLLSGGGVYLAVRRRPLWTRRQA